MELKDYLRMLRKGWYWFIVTFAAVFAVDYKIIHERETEYLAEAEMLVRLEQFSMWDLLPAGRQILKPYINLETRVTTLRGGPVFERAADILRGEKPYTSGKVSPDLQAQAREEMNRLEQEVLADEPGTDFRGYLIASLEDSIAKIERDPRSKDQLVPIQATATTRDRAVAFVNAHAEAAFQHDQEAARGMNERALAKIGAEVSEAQEIQENREQEKHQFSERQGVFDLQSKEEILQEDIQKLGEKQQQLQTDLNLNKERIREWLEDITRERIAGVSAFAAGELDSPVLHAIGRDLAAAQKALDRLLHGRPVHTEKSPQYQRAKAEVVSLEESYSLRRQELLMNKKAEQEREMDQLMSESRILEKEIVEHLEGRKRAKQEALGHLANIRLKAVKFEQDLEDARTQVRELTKMQRELERMETEIEGPVVFYSPAQKAEQIMGQAERTVTRIFVLALVAFILGLGIVYFLEYIDTRVVTLGDVKRYLDLPLIGMIHKERGSACLLDLPLDHIVAEKFNTAATLVQSAAAEKDLKAIMLVSTNQGEGKTTLAVNLGVALARKGQRVILVDGDLRRPALHLLLGVENVYGLTRLVADRTDPARVLEDLAAAADLAGYDIDPYIQPTGVENLSIVPSGPLPENPPQVLESPYMGVAIKALCDKADFVLFDTPPLNAIGDALSLARYVKGCVFVVGAGRLENHEASWARNLLKSVSATVLGVLLNFASQEARDYYYYNRGGRPTRGRHRV